MPVSKKRKKSQSTRRPVVRTQGPGATAPVSSRRPKRRRNTRRWLITAASVIIGLLVIGSFGLTTIPFGRQGNTPTPTGPGTPVAYMPVVVPPDNQLPEGQAYSDYSTIPPTSGPYWPTAASCGIYDEELPDERLVHNLEQGNVVVSYNLSDPAEVEQLKDVLTGLNDWSSWGIARPYSNILEGTVALTAWGYIQQVQGVDETAIRDFFQAYAEGGAGSPEVIPCT